MRILFAGGGTLGSVTPLLAVSEKIKQAQPDTEFFWIATRRGPEAEIVDQAGIKVYKIFSGKLRRYFDWRNFVDPFRIVIGFFQALFLLKRIQPQRVVGAGGFVQVPVMCAAYFLKIPIFLHQQDIKPSLSNLLVARLAKSITVNFTASAKIFENNKIKIIGNPAREKIFHGDPEVARKMFNLKEGVPTIVILGGGTGAAKLNRLVWDALGKLVKRAQMIHSVGRKKISIERDDAARYHYFEFLGDELKNAYSVADLVISRGGMGTLTELSAHGVPTIIVPISGTHQIDNAKFFAESEAALYFDENQSAQKFADLIIKTLEDKELLKRLSENIKKLYNPGSAELLASIILETK